jgi:hypothetical protein
MHGLVWPWFGCARWHTFELVCMLQYTLNTQHTHTLCAPLVSRRHTHTRRRRRRHCRGGGGGGGGGVRCIGIWKTVWCVRVTLQRLALAHCTHTCIWWVTPTRCGVCVFVRVHFCMRNAGCFCWLLLLLLLLLLPARGGSLWHTRVCRDNAGPLCVRACTGDGVLVLAYAVRSRMAAARARPCATLSSHDSVHHHHNNNNNNIWTQSDCPMSANRA